MPRNQRSAGEAVRSLDLVDHQTRISIGLDGARDAPQGVPGPHHVAVDHGTVWAREGVRHRACDDTHEETDPHEEGEAPPANTCSMHRSMVPERVFDVKCLLEHMFASS